MSAEYPAVIDRRYSWGTTTMRNLWILAAVFAATPLFAQDDAPASPFDGGGGGGLAALANGPAAEELKKMNDDLMAKITAVLKPDQQAGFKKFQSDEIKKAGGFAALKVVMEEAGAPLTAEQEPQIQTLYSEDAQQRVQLFRESQGRPDPAKLADLERTTMGKVARLLTPAQRKALLDSRTKQQ